MAMFIFYLKEEPATDLLITTLKKVLLLDDTELDPLMGENADALVKFNCLLRGETEFKAELSLYWEDKFCFTREIYNDLQLAMPLAKELQQDIVIDDGSGHPYQWLLVKPDGALFVVRELIDHEDDYALVVDYSYLFPVSLEKALKMQASREDIEHPERRTCRELNQFWWKDEDQATT